MNYEYDYSELKKHIIRVFGCQCLFAEKMKMSKAMISNRLIGKVPWKDHEIDKAIFLLNLDPKSIIMSFYNVKMK